MTTHCFASTNLEGGSAGGLFPFQDERLICATAPAEDVATVDLPDQVAAKILRDRVIPAAARALVAERRGADG